MNNSNKPKRWDEQELKSALDLYFDMKRAGKTVSEVAPEIEHLASCIGRSAAAVRMRLDNYRWLDTEGRVGLSNGGPKLIDFWERNKKIS